MSFTYLKKYMMYILFWVYE